MNDISWKKLALPVTLLLSGCATQGGRTSLTETMARTRIVDISHPLTEQMPVYPGGTPMSAKVKGTVEKDGYYIRDFTVGEHTGTHVDAPAHFAAGAKTVDQLPVESLAGPAAVLDVSAKASENADYEVTVADIEAWEQKHGALEPRHIVLIRTGWASRWPDEVRYRNADASGVMHFPGVSMAASQLLSTRQVRGIGIDTLSTDPGPSKTFQQHRHFLSGGGYHIENLADLSALPAEGAYVVVQPVSVQGGSGSPARVLAFIPQESR
ncbi:MAG TPA: cyclase family protein [Archangium sp.]|uniref:cyclase family protein n=1 Tax=Archangium sp. TaxID=1872627 RepID=UPI002E35D8CC|nr:cyclase family protein [Archangium sp.]HEX5751566.1 cyclase family protein [Archangium sp.]